MALQCCWDAEEVLPCHGAKEQKLIHARVTQAIQKSGIQTKSSVSVDAPFYENSSQDLFKLPVVTHFEKDAGPYFTSSIVFAKIKKERTKILPSTEYYNWMTNTW